MKVGIIVNSLDIVKELLENKMSIKTAKKINKLNKEIKEVIEIYDKKRIEVCEELGTLDKEKNSYNFGDNTEKAIEKINELLLEEITIDAELLEESDLPSTLEISPQNLERIQWIFKGAE